jgi:hypothetical protein
MSPSGSNPDFSASALMSPSASCGHDAALALGSYVPIASFAAAQKAERLFAVFDEPPYGTSMPGAGAESLRSLRRNIFGRHRGIAIRTRVDPR